MNSPNYYLRLGVLTALLSCAGAAFAQNGTIHDTAVFFSEPAKAEAGRNIAELGRRFHKDLVIETFREIPAELKQGVSLQDKPAMNRLFEQWAVKQAQQLRVNGVYVLLSKEPSHLHVLVGNETQRAAFSLRDRDALVTLMLGKLRAQQNDAALLDGVNFVLTTVASHATTRNQPKPTTAGATAGAGNQSDSAIPWGTILAVVLGVAVIWIVVGLLRSRSQAGGAAAGAAPPLPGGGGFFSSLLGGMFGAAAGMWLYDQFSGSHGSAWGADQDHGGGNDSGFGRADSNYSGSGDDFGGGSGGDDSGGDSGGGDF